MRLAAYLKSPTLFVDVILYALLGGWLGYAQVRWREEWFYAGHSLTPFIILSTGIAVIRRGAQARLNITAGLIAAVIFYYGTWALYENSIYFYPPQVAVWCIASIPAAFIFSYVVDRSIRFNRTSCIWAGIITGSIIADVISTRIGLPSSRVNWMASFGNMVRTPDALLVFGVVGVVMWTCYIIVINHRRHNLKYMLATLPGIAIGSAVSVAPGILNGLS